MLDPNKLSEGTGAREEHDQVTVGASGVAFALHLYPGFAIGLVTNQVPRVGSLVWIAEPTYLTLPTVQDAVAVERWRWPVLIPALIMLGHGLGSIPVPPRLAELPLMRSNSFGKWQAVQYVALPDGRMSLRSLGPTDDRSLPLSWVMNEDSLRDRLVSGWSPEDTW